MHWKRRQPRWPYLFALGSLFAATLFAPGWWRGRRSEPEVDAVLPRPRTSAIPSRSSSEAARTAIDVPSLPPLSAPAPEPGFDRPDFGAGPTAPAPLAATIQESAVVESDDYVVIDEPLAEARPALVISFEPAMPAADAAAVCEANIGPVTGGPAGECEAAADPANDIPCSVDAIANRSVLVRNVPAPPAPAEPLITVESLVRMRDALVTLVDQARQHLPAPAPAAPPEPAPNAMRVVVESENDRLAMIPDLAEPVPVGRPLTIASPDEATAQWPTGPVQDVAPLAPAALPRRPEALLRDLAALPDETPSAAWAHAVEARLESLSTPPAPEPRTVQSILDELRRLSVEGASGAMESTSPAEQTAWLRAARALDRRLLLWQMLLDPRIARELAARAAVAPERDGALLQSLHEAAALTAGTEEGAAWRIYLRLDDLASLTSVGSDDFAEERRAAARDVLLRMIDRRLSAEQRAFLAQPALVALEHDLHPWASGPVALDALAALLEHFELTGSLGDADAMAELRLRMRWSDDPRLASLADDMNRNYRNANVRMALSTEMLNRLIPPQTPVVAPVNEQIAGTAVRGRSRTETQVRLRLLPDTTVWRLSLDVDGAVQSQTYSDVGPARVRNACRMEYRASKLLVLDGRTLLISPAEATVNGRNTLVGVESRLDPVPIVGSIVENVVREKHRENRGAALAYVKAKVGREARSRMDREADAKLRELEARFAADVLEPLARFALELQPVDMSTTDARAVMRLRMAGEQHLAAHTPRPSAPSDSVASLQLHESAFNNAIRGLGLDGRRLTVGELHGVFASKFTRRKVETPADLPQRAIVEFAAHDGVRVACHSDCVELTLRIVELRKGRDSIRNVGVHAFFRPVLDGMEVKLVRDGTLQFEGAHLRTGPRLVLHSVFGKLLRRDQEVPVLTERLSDDPRFAGLMVTQMVIDDGWVALSVGPATPARMAWRTRGAATR